MHFRQCVLCPRSSASALVLIMPPCLGCCWRGQIHPSNDINQRQKLKRSIFADKQLMDRSIVSSAAASNDPIYDKAKLNRPKRSLQPTVEVSHQGVSWLKRQQRESEERTKGFSDTQRHGSASPFSKRRIKRRQCLLAVIPCHTIHPLCHCFWQIQRRMHQHHLQQQLFLLRWWRPASKANQSRKRRQQQQRPRHQLVVGML